MMDFKNKNKYISLFDFYQKLFTAKQQEYFKLHFIEDFSLNEISKLKNVSRAAAYDSISNIIKQINVLEEKLKLMKKNLLREKVYKKYYEDNKKIIDELRMIDDIE